MTVALATLDDLRNVVADLLDTNRPLVVNRAEARHLLGISDTKFGQLQAAGIIRPVPHLQARYSIELLRRFAAGDEHAFSTHPGGEVPEPAGANDGDTSASPVPLRPRRGRATGTETDRTAGEPSPPAA